MQFLKHRYVRSQRSQGTLCDIADERVKRLPRTCAVYRLQTESQRQPNTPDESDVEFETAGSPHVVSVVGATCMCSRCCMFCHWTCRWHLFVEALRLSVICSYRVQGRIKGTLGPAFPLCKWKKHTNIECEKYAMLRLNTFEDVHLKDWNNTRRPTPCSRV